ncbi:MAG: hypothetical protein DRG09_05655 [Epsilonproteobacteria bacterium]|nr:MAG: hypothetical protein DRG09_05655 [Campylobacterota bacterium]
MHIILYLILALAMLQAQSIDTLIKQSLKKHPSLQSIEHRLSAMNERIEASQNFSNPDISFTVNNIPFNDPSNRSLEPMQYEAVNFKQKFPWFGKLDARKTYTLAQKDVIMDSYDAAKVKLAEEIRMTAYTVKELESRIAIVNKYKSVANQNIKLYTSYASTQTKSHTSSMSASLLLSKIKIRAQRYNTVLKSQKARLNYLIQGKIHSVSDVLHITAPKSLGFYLSKLENNPAYRMKISQQNVASANKTIQELSTNPDPYVKMGYFHRAAFEDYTSITVGFVYPLYGTEELNTESARKEMLSAQSASLDYRSSLHSDIEIMYAKLTEAYQIYKIIKDESLPQLEHMFELSQSNIQRGGDLFAYTSLLEQKLSLEEELISIKAEYLRTGAKLKSLTGAL